METPLGYKPHTYELGYEDGNKGRYLSPSALAPFNSEFKMGYLDGRGDWLSSLMPPKDDLEMYVCKHEW
jgi:hypothetical protein